MSLGSLVGLDGMSPMLHGLLVSLVVVSSRILSVVGHGVGASVLAGSRLGLCPRQMVWSG